MTSLTFRSVFDRTNTLLSGFFSHVFFPLSISWNTISLDTDTCLDKIVESIVRRFSLIAYQYHLLCFIKFLLELLRRMNVSNRSEDLDMSQIRQSTLRTVLTFFPFECVVQFNTAVLTASGHKFFGKFFARSIVPAHSTIVLFAFPFCSEVCDAVSSTIMLGFSRLVHHRIFVFLATIRMFCFYFLSELVCYHTLVQFKFLQHIFLVFYKIDIAKSCSIIDERE